MEAPGSLTCTVLADLQLGLVPAAAPDQPRVVIPPLMLQHQLATHHQLQVTPHNQGAGGVPASPTPGDIKEVTASRSREDDGGDLNHQPPATSVSSDSAQNSSGKAKLPSPKMIFSDLYRSSKSPFTKLRSSLPQPLQLSSDYDADLVSKDKAKQKEAVRRFLAQKVRTDWDFTWPPPVQPSLPSSPPTVPDAKGHVALALSPRHDASTRPGAVAADTEPASKDAGEEADSESGAETDYSVVSDDPARLRPRAEWNSDLSDDDEAVADPSPFRFDSPDAVGPVVQASMRAKKRRRRRAVREEMEWNEGLACFEARRNAWTGARTVRLKPKPPTPVSPASPRRLFWRAHHRADSAASNAPPSPTTLSTPPTTSTGQALSSPLSPTTTHVSHRTNSPPPSDPDTGSNASSVTKPTSGEHADSPLSYPVETILPVPPPLLPTQNGMRASVTPSIYPSLYDKIVVHSLQPSCPVNLGDMLRACVVGWKRDGEWPPKLSMAPPPAAIHPSYAALSLRAHRKSNSIAASRPERAQKPTMGTSTASRRMSFGALLGRGEDKEKDKSGTERRDSHHDDDSKGIRKSLKHVFSLGHGAANFNTAIGGADPTHGASSNAAPTAAI